jgi:RNA polymerase sigma-70 factor (ECF subfamily)
MAWTTCRESVIELVAAARAGDDEALSRLLHRYRHGVYALCLDRTGDFDLAEDLTQDTILKAHAQLHTLRDPAAFPAWLRRIAVNACCGWLRRKCSETVEYQDALRLRATEDTFRAAARREAAREIRSALARLPENNRLALVMFYLRGDSRREIAEFLDVSETTVTGRLHRARAQLRRLLAARIRDYLTCLGY